MRQFEMLRYDGTFRHRVCTVLQIPNGDVNPITRSAMIRRGTPLDALKQEGLVRWLNNATNMRRVSEGVLCLISRVS